MSRQPVDRSILMNALANLYGGANNIPASVTRKELYSKLINPGIVTEGETRWIWNDPAHESGQRAVYLTRPRAGAVPSQTSAPRKTRRVERVVQVMPPPPVLTSVSNLTAPAPAASTANAAGSANPLAIFNGAGLDAHTFIPDLNPQYIPFGIYGDLRVILASRRFHPVWIAGLSGNGKTETVNQICAELGREVFRVNITSETDEFDLIGGMHLDNGNTVFRYGPVIEAMRRGAILLLDEIDYASFKIACLQPVLEGKPVFVKKTGELVRPAAGFNIIATANTKGQGDSTGKFLGTGNMNEALLERFPITLVQDYPTPAIEKKILAGYLRKVLGVSQLTDSQLDFIDCAAKWAAQIRETFRVGAASEVISTRRLVWAIDQYALFGEDRLKAIRMSCNRFDELTSDGFVNLYSKLDPTVTSVTAVPVAPAPSGNNNDASPISA